MKYKGEKLTVNDLERLLTLEVDLLFLDENTPESAPADKQHIEEYIQIESGMGDSISYQSLDWVRTAKINDNKYWLWRFVEKGGAEYFVGVECNNTDEICLGLDENDMALTPEQFLIGRYYGLV